MATQLTVVVTVWVILMMSGIGCVTDSRESHPEMPLDSLAVLIESQLEAWHVPGLAIGIVKDGETIFMQGFGYRDREQKLPVTTETLFPIASCSKAFTALSAAMAAEDNLLNMKTPIIDYIPDFQLIDEKATRKATLKDFLQHRVGFPSYRLIPWLSGASRDEVFQRLKYFETTSNFRKECNYSNLGYTIAGYVVGRAADTSWEEFTRQRIFTPLEMTSTGFSVEEMTDGNNYAIGYLNLLDWDEPQRIGVATLTTFSPAGGIISNIEDMVKWLQFNLDGGRAGDNQLVPAKRLRDLYKPHSDFSASADGNYVTEMGYAYGWWAEKYRGYTHVYHGGLGRGYISQVSIIPEENIGIVVLTNLYYTHLEQSLIHHVLDQLLGLPAADHLESSLSGVTGYLENWQSEYDAFWDGTSENARPTKELSQFLGTYSNPLYGQASVTLDAEGMNLIFESGIVLGLRHYDTDTFATETGGMELFHKLVIFLTGDTGRIDAFTIPLEDGVADVRFSR